jgi:hypothetical protein
MKKILINSMIALALLLSSCENDFDPQIYGKLFSSNFPKTEADYESYMMTLYIPFNNTWTYNVGHQASSNIIQHTMYIPEGGFMRMFDSTSDVCYPWTVGNWGGGWLQLTQANYANCILYGRSSGGGSPSHYEKIRDVTRATEIIGTLESATVISDNKQKQFIGEARLLRGLLMYNLLHIYGPVPVIIDPALIGNEEAEQNLVRPSLEEMVKYIYDDFDYAQQNMANSGPKGRYTADYAKFCLMRHSLNEGNYDKAIEMYQALNTGKYSLYTAGGSEAYADQFKQGHKFNSEVIMALSTSVSGDGTVKKGDFNPLSFYLVPANASRYADVANTIPTPFVLQGGGWEQCFNVSPDFYDTYEEGDVRREVILTSYVQNNADRRVNTREDIGVRWSGFILNKYPIEINNAFQASDVPLARWADVLLMYAEAVARKSNVVPAGDAMQAITDVRARAGLPAFSGAAVASYEGFLEALLAERGHEFLYEGGRKIDLIRFNKYRHNCKLYKKTTATHQYMPLPNFAVQQAETYGKTLVQTFERDGWAQDN